MPLVSSLPMFYNAAMSIKRQRQYSSASRSTDASEKKKKASKDKNPAPDWEEKIKDQSADAFAPYAMTTKFEKETFLLHPTFGRGFVMTDEGTRIEVLFESGVKKLMHAMAPPRPEPEPTPEPEPEPEPEPTPEPEPEPEPEAAAERPTVPAPESYTIGAPDPGPEPEPEHADAPEPEPENEPEPTAG
jgi:hypothetical protein